MSESSKYATSSSSKKPDLPTWSSGRVAKLKEQEREKQRQADKGKQAEQQQEQHNPPSTSIRSNGSSTSRWANIDKRTELSGSQSKPQSSSLGRAELKRHHPASTAVTSNAASTSTSISSQSSNYSSSKSSFSSHDSIRDASNPSSSPFKRNTLKPLGGELNLMELLSSPSRGIDEVTNSIRMQSDGKRDAKGVNGEEIKDLTHHPTQHLFREYISKKIGTHASTFKSHLSDPTSNPSTFSSASNSKSESVESTSQSSSNLTTHFELLALPSSSASQSSTSKRRNNLRLLIDKERGSLEEILLLIRKLREGIVASHREVDEFVIDVYSLSTYVSLLVGNHSQLKSSLNRLVLELYPILLSKSSKLDESQSSNPHSYKNDLNLLLGEFDPLLFPTSTSRQEELHHLSSILLLSVSCLPFGSGTLGAYSENQSKGQKLEYSILRRAIDDILNNFRSDPSTSNLSHLSIADSVAEAFNHHDGQAISKLLGSKNETSSKPSVFQRLLILQKLNVVRENSWNVLKKSYLNVGLSLPFQIEGYGESEKDREETDSSWIERILILDLNSIPASSEELARIVSEEDQVQKTSKIKTETPDDWDSSISSIDKQSITEQSLEPDQLFKVRMRRIGSFLETLTPAPSKASSSVEKSEGIETSDEAAQRVKRLEDLRKEFIPEAWIEKVSVSSDGKRWSLSLR